MSEEIKLAAMIFVAVIMIVLTGTCIVVARVAVRTFKELVKQGEIKKE